MATKNYEIKAKLNSDKTVTGMTSKHEILMDATTTKGMTPLEALLNGLCGCEISVINYYGPKLFGLELQELEMEVKAWRDPEPADEYYGLRKLSIHWIVKSNKTLEEFKEIIKYAHKTCPVFNTLSGRIVFEDTITIK
ncbi:OsmC family protein [Mycoplasma bradburyae]|uniref:OsmC family protein n=1 Tax=Mycoplasma bradburyae TaxID=2963128 RepID=A0AAW6HRN4_9MOLU|nr:OsmC family protein [Mycoplasma bradburyae]MDC4163074.1 OsmC family protein [Mycoplasma bradburyae]MDC4181665.1 OsmC family protein [Mycoplasma bradburyae]MDC4182392.1 OsmC family protein [Mycoplasma bradburyae]MDC4183119.1 OsmC family protein [Mycoplasma bradburyae]MDC4183842.1 OsmC family protein [Mycoplasma bradburyae]